MSAAKDSAPNYKDTVLLPKTDFPMKADLVQREPIRLKKWEDEKLYFQIQAASQGKPTFILHDGPPFANGDVHMGTALNKVLKDLVVKSKAMAGFHAPFIPGWDTHGLPIEFKVVKEAKDLAPAEIRTRSEAYARKFIDIQRGSFKRLGVFGDWENPYLTLAPTYEADIMRTFGKFVEQDIVYRSKKPVLWSFGAQTALAEAEVEYKEKTSPAVYVAFALNNPPPGADGCSLVIWTTTPWTLPANLAIALHPTFEYTAGTFTHDDGRSVKLVVANSRIEAFAAATGFKLTGHTDKLKGAELNGCEAQHPFLPRTSKVINTLFVTDDTGTGAVHIAPGHGADDYIAGREHGLEILSPSMTTASTPKSAACRSLSASMCSRATRASSRSSKPTVHCWATNPTCTSIRTAGAPRRLSSSAPYRSSSSRSMPSASAPFTKSTKSSGFQPGVATASMAQSRAVQDWCISRQRTWGVPLPVFYLPDGEIAMTREIIEKVATAVETHGTNLWFEKDDQFWSDLVGLPDGSTRCKDTLDVWIDSGCSHVAVLDRHPELHAPADMYLEATDQHRGWFQSSLMVSIAARGTAPYKCVITHGFVVDTTGKKISKSEQGAGGKNEKPMTADHYYNKYGADMVPPLGQQRGLSKRSALQSGTL